MSRRAPILVTGSHCSGTTWVGRMLAASASIAYIHEPFNPERVSGVSGPVFSFWYTYVCRQNEQRYDATLRKTIGLRYGLGEALADGRTGAYRKAARRYARSLKRRALHYRPLVKDPIAFFSAPWLAERFRMSVLVLIRHPAAFAGSLKMKGWKFPFAHMRDQPELMRNRLDAFESEVESFAETERDIVDQAALLWKIIAHVILCYQEEHPGWIFRRHEDLSRDPIGSFRHLYHDLDLSFGDEAVGVIRRHCFPGVQEGGKNGAGVVLSRVRRDSAANLFTWKNRLTESEVQRVKASVHEYSRHFYTEGDW